MLPLQFIRNNKDKIILRLSKRNFKNIKIIEHIISIDETCRKIQVELDNELSNANNINKQIGKLFKENKNIEVEELKEKSLKIKSITKNLQNELKKNKDELLNLRTQVPNLPDEKVPTGISDNDNEEVYKNDKIASLDKDALPHWELAEKNKIIDFELGNKITGAGFPVYIGKGAKLQRALINYLLDKNISAGYKEYQVPHLVNEDSGFATGQLPDKEGQMYHIKNENLYIIPTAEVPLTNLYRNKLHNHDELPISMTGYTPCFRREAGSYGRDTKGLIRLHQFNKVELYWFCDPNKSLEAHKEITADAESILKKLNLPYRLVDICTGDLGFSSSRTFDLEVWLPSSKCYREISSCSNCLDFQARRSSIRTKIDKKNSYIHTLNGSGLAIGRTMAAILENGQQGDGSVKIPDALVPYFGSSFIKTA